MWHLSRREADDILATKATYEEGTGTGKVTKGMQIDLFSCGRMERRRQEEANEKEKQHTLRNGKRDGE